MEIKLKETGEIKVLTYIDPRTGIDSILDFVGNNGALSDGQFERNDNDDVYVADADTYDWWATVAADNQALEARIHELRVTHGDNTVDAALSAVGRVDLEDLAALANAELDKAANQS